MFKTFKETLGVVGLILVIALALSIPTCAAAQQGAVEAPQQTVEEMLTTEGPVSMQVVWNYVVSEFGDPHVAAPIIFYEAYMDPPIFHIQAVKSQDEIMHQDIPLEAFTPGGAISNDGLFEFTWFCAVDLDAPEDPCFVTKAMFVFAYDNQQKALLAWPERIPK